MTQTKPDTMGVVRNWYPIERLALGELSASEEATLRAKLVADGLDPDRLLADLRASNATILAAHPPSRAAAVITRRMADAQPARSRWWVYAPMFAATVIVLFLIGVPNHPELVDEPASSWTGQQEAPPEDGILLKGAEARLVIHRQTAEGAQRLRDGQPVAEGDVLQVSYIAAGAHHGVIVSIDGRGVVTQHFPPPAEAATTNLEQGGAIPLGTAYELDDAPAFERFFFVTSQGPHHVHTEVVFQAAATLAATHEDGAVLPLPAGLSQFTFLLRKVGQHAGSHL